MQSRRFSALPVIGIVTIVYFIAGKLGLSLAFLYASASPVWPPAGIALAVLLLLGYRIWPAIFVGAFLVNANYQSLFWCNESCTWWFCRLGELWRDLADVVAGRHNGRSSDRSIDYSLERCIETPVEQEPGR